MIYNGVNVFFMIIDRTLSVACDDSLSIQVTRIIAH